MTIPMIKEQHLDTIRNYLLDIPVDFLRSAMDYRTLLIMTGNILSNFNDTSLFNMYSPTSGRVVTLKTGRQEMLGPNPGRACRPSRSEFSVVFSETRVNTG